MAKLDDQLKVAIVQMPQKEKDKLLLRLVVKDKKLVSRLTFELLEGSATRDSRAADVRSLIEEGLPRSSQRDNTPGWLLMAIRSLNGQITAHVNTTKDKPGEVILGAFLLAEAIRRNDEMLRKMARRADTIAPYMVKRAADLIKKAARIHEDYYMEFRTDLTEVLWFLHSYPPAQSYISAINLPGRWDG